MTAKRRKCVRRCCFSYSVAFLFCRRLGDDDEEPDPEEEDEREEEEREEADVEEAASQVPSKRGEDGLQTHTTTY